MTDEVRPMMYDYAIGRYAEVRESACWMCGVGVLPTSVTYGTQYYLCKQCQVEWKSIEKGDNP